MAVAKRCFVMSKKAGATDAITLTGGCSKNAGLKQAIEHVLKLKVIDPVSYTHLDVYKRQVLGTVAVDLLHMGLDLPGRQMLTLLGTARAALDLGVRIRVDKDVQRVVVLENNIGGPAHDDAVALLGEVLDDLALGHCHADGPVSYTHLNSITRSKVAPND